MVPKKAKGQGKRNKIKIKSKVIQQKHGAKITKKTNPLEKPLEKPLENLNWLKNRSNDRLVKKCSGVPEWLDTGGYKHTAPQQRSSDDANSEYAEYQQKEDEGKSTASDMSEECNCSLSKYSDGKGGILKRKSSSTNSLVAKYIKSGMNHVASFIVESAIRFGEQHGVVVPDKNTPNVYEITPPDKLDEKFRKIRFKIPEKTLDYEDAMDKKMMWKSHQSPNSSSLKAGTTGWKAERSKPSPRSSSRDSLEEILPLLEKLKDEGKVIKSELDLEKLTGEVNRERRERDRGRERDRDREGERNREREGDRERERKSERKRDRESERERGRHRERLREKFRSLGKRFKSLGAVMGKGSEEKEYTPGDKSPWKKFRRDSLELGRQRLRTLTCPRKTTSRSRTPY